jgi:hypothetical protein
VRESTVLECVYIALNGSHRYLIETKKGEKGQRGETNKWVKNRREKEEQRKDEVGEKKREKYRRISESKTAIREERGHRHAHIC